MSPAKRAERKFARFYYDDFLREYPEVYADDAAFAAWWRLLVAAEQSWPIPPDLPRSVKAKALTVLTTVGLIALGPRHTYAVLGHQKDRARRHGIAVSAANTRHANGAANGHANAPANGRANGGADDGA